MRQTLLTVDEEIHQYNKNLEIEYREDQDTISELSSDYITLKLQNFQKNFESQPFSNLAEEIFYYKYVKAHLLALLKYNTLVQKTEIKKPYANGDDLKAYYQSAAIKAKKKLRKNEFFYKYYTSNRNELDKAFFGQLNQEQTQIYQDEKIDFRSKTVKIFAKIEAYSKFHQYLKSKLKSVEMPEAITTTVKTNLRWTISKTDLIELIYALHAAGVINNGQAEIKEIAESLQHVFNVELGQYNRVFYDIRARKINKTKFLDALKESLAKRIKDFENELYL